MTNRERFRRALNFQSIDRLPILEWAGWWDKTILRWHREGLPDELEDAGEIREYLGLDRHRQCWIAPSRPLAPGYGLGIVKNTDDYFAIRPHLCPDRGFDQARVRQWAERQNSGEMVVWISLEGFFWFPRELFGIEGHLLAFYDQPDLMKQMNEDLLQFNLQVLERFCEICVPDFMTFAEDMSYNHGPMISKALFDEFLAPYYRRITPVLAKCGIPCFVDTDGDVTLPASWFAEVGVDGLLPLERMAGVDVAKLRTENPSLKMIGGFDKRVMHRGENEMRREFERLLPIARQGGFIMAVDHQTPPEVSFQDYLLYLRLLSEYCRKAVTG